MWMRKEWLLVRRPRGSIAEPGARLLQWKRAPAGEHSKDSITVSSPMTGVTTDLVLVLLRENGWRLRWRSLAEGDDVYVLERRDR